MAIKGRRWWQQLPCVSLIASQSPRCNSSFHTTSSSNLWPIRSLWKKDSFSLLLQFVTQESTISTQKKKKKISPTPLCCQILSQGLDLRNRLTLIGYFHVLSSLYRDVLRTLSSTFNQTTSELPKPHPSLHFR